MKQVIFLSILFSFFNLSAKCQYKILKLESDNIFIRYYYKTDSSDEIKNDSTSFLCIRQSNNSIVRIEKFINSNKVWSNLYVIRRVKKKLINSQKTRGNIKTLYEPYYITKLISPAQ